jgi:hypothetical protein
MEARAGVQTAFAEPGLQIDTQALRDLYAGLRDLLSELDEGFDAQVEEVRLLIELPERFATPFANALIATDVAWRIGCLAGEADRWGLLPEGTGSSNLNEVLPIEEFGLELVAVEDGSIKGKLEYLSKKATYGSVVATIALMQQFAGVTIHSDPADPAAHGQGAPIEITIPETTHEVVGNATGELPSLPAGTKVIAEVNLADGTTVRITGPDTSQ